mmetsp:Transcript_32367/g.91722  ORF Transcript_32367/g.91722 Transcript_32367/m.91722 type:complete len:209 (+) Transcript_32367:227-853(+)
MSPVRARRLVRRGKYRGLGAPGLQPHGRPTSMSKAVSATCLSPRRPFPPSLASKATPSLRPWPSPCGSLSTPAPNTSPTPSYSCMPTTRWAPGPPSRSPAPGSRSAEGGYSSAWATRSAASSAPPCRKTTGCGPLRPSRGTVWGGQTAPGTRATPPALWPHCPAPFAEGPASLTKGTSALCEPPCKLMQRCSTPEWRFAKSASFHWPS